MTGMSASWSAAAAATAAPAREPAHSTKSKVSAAAWLFSRVRARARCVRSMYIHRGTPFAEVERRNAPVSSRSRRSRRSPEDRPLSLSLSRALRPVARPSPPSFHFLHAVIVCSMRVVWRTNARACRITPPFFHALSFSFPFSLFLSLARSLFNALPPRSTPLRNVTPTSGEGALISST